MTYTARIIEKRRENGLLKVIVEYSDGINTFRDEIASRSAQDPNWISSEVQRRLTDLEGLDILEKSIQLGPVTLKSITTPKVKTSRPKQEYEANYKKFTAWLEALRQGIVTVDRKAFVDLKQWLIDNWKDEYVELFLR